MKNLKLFLCEKPSQGKDIGKVLGATIKKPTYVTNSDGSIVVTWAIGHLLEQYSPEDYSPDYKVWDIDHLPIVPQEWRMGVKDSVKTQYEAVSNLLKKADEVVIATDADREGEVIGVEILEQNKYRGKRSRLWLSALDEKSIQKALNDIRPAEKTYPLYLAGLGRQRADWLLGMSGSRGLSIVNKGRVDGVMSVGRVQTPTLKIVVDRDNEIENFKPTKYFDVEIMFKHENGEYKAKFIPTEDMLKDDYLVDKAIAEKVLKEVLEGNTSVITDYKKQKKKKAAPLGYSLSQLQKEASSLFGYSANDTLEIAQALYETHKATTYPRSDCQYLPDEQESEIQEVVQAIYDSNPGDEQLSKIQSKLNLDARTQIWNTGKVTAHHAIIPTSAKFDINRLSDQEKNLYLLIRNNYLMQFLGDYVYNSTAIKTDSSGHQFESKGSSPIELGWREIARSSDKKKEDLLPDAEKGDSVEINKSQIADKETKPRPRFTEGTLIDAMKNVAKFVEDPELKKVLRENSGIGTEATRANIIKTLFDKNYLEKEGKKALKSTKKGRMLIEVAPKVMSSPETTSLWEQELEDVADSKSSLDTFMEAQVKNLKSIIEDIKSGNCTLKTAAVEHECKTCGAGLMRRKGKNGYFWACMAYPTCTQTYPDARNKPDYSSGTTGPKKTGENCPKCESEIHEKKGKNGVFYACSGYPKCNTIFIKSDEGFVESTPENLLKTAKKTGHSCPKCNTDIVERKGAYGMYFVCSDISCKTTFHKTEDGFEEKIAGHAVGKKTGHQCPSCSADIIERTGKYGNYFGCANYAECGKIFVRKGEGFEPKGKASGKEVGHKCPSCSSEIIEREGKNGVFYACSGFPKCKETFRKVGDKYVPQSAGTTDIQCPACKKGKFTLRRGKSGPFFGCSNYSGGCRETRKATADGKMLDE